jgi:hypothetical protein
VPAPTRRNCAAPSLDLRKKRAGQQFQAAGLLQNNERRLVMNEARAVEPYIDRSQNLSEISPSADINGKAQPACQPVPEIKDAKRVLPARWRFGLCSQSWVPGAWGEPF